MAGNESNGLLRSNQDMVRAGLEDLDRQTLTRAMFWMAGNGPQIYPISVHLNLTLRCRGHCVHCRQWTWPHHNEFTITQLEKLLDVFAVWGVQTLTLGGGNPLLHHAAADALHMTATRNIQTGIITESVGITEKLADAICQHARWIRFSLDGPTPQINDGIRNTPGLFDQGIADIRRLQLRRKELDRPLEIGLNCVVQKGNLNSLTAMMDLARRLEVDFLLFKIAHGNDPNGRFLLSITECEQLQEWVNVAQQETGKVGRTNLKQLAALLGTVFRKEDMVRGRPVASYYQDTQALCFAPLLFLTCNSEGQMYPCDYLQADTRAWAPKFEDMRGEFCLGNVLQDNQQVLERLGRLMRARVHGLPAAGFDECGSCTRFCQLNAALTEIYRSIPQGCVTEQAIAERVQYFAAKPSGAIFL